MNPTQRKVVDYEELRAWILRLNLYVVIDDDDQHREVADRNLIDRPRVLDAVLLDDLWEAIETAAAEPRTLSDPEEVPHA